MLLSWCSVKLFYSLNGWSFNWTLHRLEGCECAFLSLSFSGVSIFMLVCMWVLLYVLLLFHCCDFILPIECIQYTLIAFCSTWMGNTFCFFDTRTNSHFRYMFAYNEIMYYPHNIRIYCTIWNSFVIELQRAFLFFYMNVFFCVWKRIEIERIKWRWANHHFHHQMEESESNKYKNVNHNANERHIKKMIRVYDTIQSAIYIYTILMWNDEINVEMWQSSTFCEIEYVYLTYTLKHKHGTNEWMKFQRKWITHARTQTNKNSMQKNKTMDRLWYIVRIKMFWLMC